jgi:hypothetical protein
MRITTEASGANGSTTGSFAPASDAPTSANSDAHKSSSKQSWRRPNNVRELAAQATTIATMLLNDKVDLELARTYAGITRVVCQAMALEVSRSRFLRSTPDLDLDEQEQPR